MFMIFRSVNFHMEDFGVLRQINANVALLLGLWHRAEVVCIADGNATQEQVHVSDPSGLLLTAMKRKCACTFL
jgi:hypothetical protein